MRPVAGFRFGARLSLGNDGCCINALAVHGASTVVARAGRDGACLAGGISQPALYLWSVPRLRSPYGLICDFSRKRLRSDMASSIRLQQHQQYLGPQEPQ